MKSSRNLAPIPQILIWIGLFLMSLIVLGITQNVAYLPAFVITDGVLLVGAVAATYAARNEAARGVKPWWIDYLLMAEFSYLSVLFYLMASYTVQEIDSGMKPIVTLVFILPTVAEVSLMLIGKLRPWNWDHVARTVMLSVKSVEKLLYAGLLIIAIMLALIYRQSVVFTLILVASVVVGSTLLMVVVLVCAQKLTMTSIRIDDASQR